MAEHVNFICLGDRALDPSEHMTCIETVPLRLEGGRRATLVETLRLDTRSGDEVVLPWDESALLVERALDEGGLLVVYFIIDGGHTAVRQSLTIEKRHGSSVVTLSLEDGLVRSSTDRLFAALSALASWAAETFGSAVMACGPELDLYEVGDELDLLRTEALLASDWRCWVSMGTHRLSRRMLTGS
jgi:hypothetical protein